MPIQICTDDALYAWIESLSCDVIRDMIAFFFYLQQTYLQISNSNGCKEWVVELDLFWLFSLHLQGGCPNNPDDAIRAKVSKKVMVVTGSYLPTSCSAYITSNTLLQWTPHLILLLVHVHQLKATFLFCLHQLFQNCCLFCNNKAVHTTSESYRI